ncbi:hypothetical protein BA6E_102103 [Bacteroidales bacterium 6E]|nr:hypothetical protein BA6E_102103 [Bacteroidales bacterium 6E]
MNFKMLKSMLHANVELVKQSVSIFYKALFINDLKNSFSKMLILYFQIGTLIFLVHHANNEIYTYSSPKV